MRLYVSEIYTRDGWTPTILWFGQDFRRVLENTIGGRRSDSQDSQDSRRVRRIKTQEELDRLPTQVAVLLQD